MSLLQPYIFAELIFQAINALNHLLPFLNFHSLPESRHGVVNQVFGRTFIRCFACYDVAFNARKPLVEGHPEIRMEVDFFEEIHPNFSGKLLMLTHKIAHSCH